MKRVSKSQKRIGLLILVISLPTFLLLTNPQNLPIPLLIFPPLILFSIIFILSYYALSRIILKRRKYSSRKLMSLSAIAAFIPVLMLVLASIGQFSIADIAIFIVLVFGLSWYLLRIDFIRE